MTLVAVLVGVIAALVFVGLVNAAFYVAEDGHIRRRRR